MNSHGFNTTPRAINGIDMTPMIPNIVLNWDCDTSGLFIIHGSGNVISTQIIPKSIINLAFDFLSFIISCCTPSLY